MDHCNSSTVLEKKSVIQDVIYYMVQFWAFYIYIFKKKKITIFNFYSIKVTGCSKITKVLQLASVLGVRLQQNNPTNNIQEQEMFQSHSEIYLDEKVLKTALWR